MDGIADGRDTTPADRPSLQSISEVIERGRVLEGLPLLPRTDDV
ncbi:hypothetical protein [Streptosporangium nondiastaticum]|nr:hypothetical protein [Streptosporangium nondiastaticum]